VQAAQAVTNAMQAMQGGVVQSSAAGTIMGSPLEVQGHPGSQPIAIGRHLLDPSVAAFQVELSPVPSGNGPDFELEVAQQFDETGLAEGGSGEARGADDFDTTATSLILRNLPTTFDQMQTQAWVDEKGYKDRYDFLLWFPAKKTSRLNTSSYAFANFRTAQDANRFRQEFHLSRFPVQDTAGEGGSKDGGGDKQQWPLSIAVAKVQGFTENYIRFHHLLEDKSPTLCKPYFAADAVETLPQESLQAAAQAATHAPHADNTLDGPATTLIIRNLPSTVESLDMARSWLDRAGFAGQYNFFIYLPPKRRRPDPGATPASAGTAPQGLGYAFVNLKKPELAQECINALNARCLQDNDPALNVVAARVQGFESCCRHFSTLSASGRVVPWVDPSMPPVEPLPPEPTKKPTSSGWAGQYQ
jgi:hypothetical protein